MSSTIASTELQLPLAEDWISRLLARGDLPQASVVIFQLDFGPRKNGPLTKSDSLKVCLSAVQGYLPADGQEEKCMSLVGYGKGSGGGIKRD